MPDSLEIEASSMVETAGGLAPSNGLVIDPSSQNATHRAAAQFVIFSHRAMFIIIKTHERQTYRLNF